MAMRHGEFLEGGARVYGMSADTPGQNAAVMEKLALPFPILSDVTKESAVRPLGFDDEDDPRQISRPGVVVISPDGEVVSRFVGRDYADRPDEDDILGELDGLDLPPTTQARPAIGASDPGEKAFPAEGLKYYFSGSRFAVLALRRRYRDFGDEWRDDTRAHIAMVDRYLEALSAVKDRRA